MNKSSISVDVSAYDYNNNISDMLYQRNKAVIPIKAATVIEDKGLTKVVSCK